MHDQPRTITWDRAPTWPVRLHELTDIWLGPLAPEARERARAQVWILVVGVLELKIRQQAGRRPDLDAEWAYDLAVSRALEILRNFAEGKWDPRDFAPGQLQNYFDLLARNSVVDHVRSRAGKTRKAEITMGAVDELAVSPADVDRGIEQAHLGDCLVACVDKLTPRARLVWFLRVFCGFSSRRIGRHPDVRMEPAAVDMVLTRSRRAVRECLCRRGYDRPDFRAGAFVACWEAFRRAGRLPDAAWGKEAES